MSGSTSFSLTSTWVKVASAGDTVEVQCRSVQPIVLVTSATAPDPNSNGSIVLRGPTQVETYRDPLPIDLYARAFGSAFQNGYA